MAGMKNHLWNGYDEENCIYRVSPFHPLWYDLKTHLSWDDRGEITDAEIEMLKKFQIIEDREILTEAQITELHRIKLGVTPEQKLKNKMQETISVWLTDVQQRGKTKAAHTKQNKEVNALQQRIVTALRKLADNKITINQWRSEALIARSLFRQQFPRELIFTREIDALMVFSHHTLVQFGQMLNQVARKKCQ